MRKLSIYIFKLFGWTAVATVPEPPKSVICIAPHTSNWDFIIGKLYYWSLNRKSSFLMKKSWFFFPIGIFLRYIGGVPVDRTKRTSVTDQIAQKFAENENFHIAITPEGTRSLVHKWKMGFYHIAVKAKVPIQLAYIDYAKKEMGITSIFIPTGDEIADLEIIQGFYSEIVGRHPEKFHNPTKVVEK